MSAAPDEALHRSLGLTDEEAASIGNLLGREPNHTELAMYAVMWSEHCSYKSSRVHLRSLPTEAPHVLVGPGENAGVIDVGDGIAVAFRIESHNHPSAIEPYQGAATGVGGILRDVFTMGARPIALADPLRFGPLDDPRSRWIAEGVISGISGYGNAVGVPTVAGELIFDETYRDNPLVNVFCLGILPAERLVLGRASGVGNLAVLLGSTTGRDGIGGASVLASAGFGEAEEESAKRPSVQVGDPFEEKRLIEACLALLDAGLVVGIQDLGAAGITGATSETASRGGVGMDVYLREVPLREADMEPFEVLTSESQERMLAIVEPGDLDEVLAICERWEVRSSVIATVTAGGRLRVLDRPDGEILADVPAATLHEDAPLYDRPRREPPDRPQRREQRAERLLDPPVDAAADLAGLLYDTSWAHSQYDHQLFLNTVHGPGGDAAVLRLKDPRTGAPTGRGLALTTDGNHRWCALDPRLGTAAVVAEAVLNLACVGARPLGLVNCLNFGNPEHAEVMWQLAESVGGLGDACRALGVPVVGGNVSLYNESRGADIAPSPVVALVGMVEDLSRPPAGIGLAEGAVLLRVGTPAPSLSSSRWAWERGHRSGSPPQVDLGGLAATAAAVRSVVTDPAVVGVHDLADGLGVALAEMAVHSGVGLTASAADHVEIFSDDPSTVVVAVEADAASRLVEALGRDGVRVERIGEAGGDRVRLADLVDAGLADLARSWHNRLPDALGSARTTG